MVLAERSCWRSGTERRGGAPRSGSARGGRAAWDTVGPITEAGACAELRAPSMGGGITARAGSVCFRGLIAGSFSDFLDLSFSLYVVDFFTASQVRSGQVHVGIGCRGGRLTLGAAVGA